MASECKDKEIKAVREKQRTERYEQIIRGWIWCCFFESMDFCLPLSLLAHLSGSQTDLMDWQETFLLISFRVFDMKASILSVVCVYFIFFCLEVEVGDGEFSANILFLIVFFHVVLLFITLLICLWQGRCCWIRSLWVRLSPPCVYCFSFLCFPL